MVAETRRLDRSQHNAHVVALRQNRHARGAYKPLAREYREVVSGFRVQLQEHPAGCIEAVTSGGTMVLLT